jgi:hypothetical protein
MNIPFVQNATFTGLISTQNYKTSQEWAQAYTLLQANSATWDVAQARLWGTITGNISAQTDLWAYLSANKDSQTLTYIPSLYRLSISNGNSVNLSSIKAEIIPTVTNYLSTNNVLISGVTANLFYGTSGITDGFRPGGAGGSIDLRGGDGSIVNDAIGGPGGSINLRGSSQEEGVYSGGSINLNAGTGGGGSITSIGVNENPGGSLDMSGGINGSGGSINTSDGGGSINTSGGDDGVGGSINTNNRGGSIDTRGAAIGLGGSINTSAGEDGVGGYINTSNGGGFIDTRIGETVGGYLGGAGGYINLRGGPGDNINEVNGNKGGYIKMTGGITANNSPNGAGYLDTSGGFESDGGNIITRGGNAEIAHGGSINLSGGNSYHAMGGSIIAVGNAARAGSINISGGTDPEGAIGGSINLIGRQGPAGSIDLSSATSGNGAGGSITAIGVADESGGSLNMNGGSEGPGGEINTSDDGGSINTRDGFIELGRTSVRTTLTGTATEPRAISLPDASGTVALESYVQSNFLNLTGGTISNNLTVQGNISALGTATFANTIFTTTSALSVYNTGPGPALYVFQASGPYDVASFYDGDGIEVLHVGNAGLSGLGKVGVNESFPNKELTVRGSISATGSIFATSFLSGGVDLKDIFLTSETDSQTLYYTESASTLFITNGNSVSLTALDDKEFATAMAIVLS